MRGRREEGREKMFSDQVVTSLPPRPCPAPGRAEGAFLIMAAACGHGDVLLRVREAQTDRQTDKAEVFWVSPLVCVLLQVKWNSVSVCMCLAVCVCVSICMSPHMSTRPGTWRNSGLYLCPSDALPPLLLDIEAQAEESRKGEFHFSPWHYEAEITNRKSSALDCNKPTFFLLFLLL